MNETVLIVDDDANLLAGLRRQLRGRFTVVTATGGEEALASLEQGEPPAVILSDMRMGGMSGVETLGRFKEKAPDTVRLMLTGNADLQTAIEAINNGHIFRFLTKPCPQDVLEAGLNAALRQHRLIMAEKELLEQTLAGSVKVLTDMLAMVAPESFARSGRMRAWLRKVVADLRLSESWQMDLAALLSPLGLLAVPGDVTAKLHKGLPLTPDEQSIVERGPEAAANIIRNIPRLGPVARIVHLRNRGFNGTGFPVDGPSGEAIPLGARVLCILTDLSAACRTDMPVAADFKVLEAHAGRYDPALLQKIRACLEVAEQPAVRVGSRMIATGFLRPGMVLAADIATTGGVLVLASRQVISEAHVEKLRNLARLRHITDAITVND